MKKALIEFEIDGEKDEETVCIDGMDLNETFDYIYLSMCGIIARNCDKIKLISIIFFEDTQ